MSKANSRKFPVPARPNGSLLVPTWLSIALLSAFSSSALANSGGIEFEDVHGTNSYGQTDSLTNNEINISDGFEGNVYGAYTKDNHQIVSGNTVTVSNIVNVTGNNYVGNVTGGAIYSAIGADSVSATANNNLVTILDSRVEGKVHGGYVDVYPKYYHDDGIEDVYANVNAYANKNTIVVSDGAVITNYIYGGYAYIEVDSGNNSAQANDNTVTVSHSTVEDYVHGGRAIGENITESSDENSTAITNNNSVTISSSEIYGNVYGGRANAITGKGHAIAVANNNTATVSSSYIYHVPDYVSGDVYGGRVEVEAHSGKGVADAEANNNIVTILNSSVDDVYGSRVNADVSEGAVANLSANENTVVISDKANIFDNVYGGYVDADVDYGNITAQVNKNTVTISNNSTVEGYVYGGYVGTGANYGGIVYANENIVVVSDGSVITNGDVSGGFALQGSIETVANQANKNTVIISGLSVIGGDVRGGRSYVETDGKEAFAEANYNTVVISHSTVGGDVTGGHAIAWFGTGTATAYANNNVVFIDSSTVTGDRIVGGTVRVDANSKILSTTNNTVSISGSYAINEGVSLYGGYCEEFYYPLYEPYEPYEPSPDDDFFTGNTLNLDARQHDTTTVDKVANFQTINLIAGNVQANGVAVLATTETSLGNGNDKGTTVNLLSVETDNLKANDQITLISGAEGTLANKGQKQFVLIGESVALGYNGEASLDDTNNVVFNIEGKDISPKTKVLSESRAAEMAFLNSAADLLRNQDIHKTGKHVFGAVRGIYNEYKTGSSVEISGVGLVTGVANTWEAENSDLTGAVFVEAGWGSFDTKNSILGNVQRGDGDSYYIGTGLIGKYDVTHGLLSGLYAEAAAHVGIISTNYSNAGLTNINGQKASYESDSLYYAAHATAGYRWNVTDSIDMDVSATYLWNYLESEEVTIIQDKFDFDSVQSHRLRLGTEVGYTAENGCRPYAGAAWEHEFDGKAGGSVEGYRLDEADLGGNSALAWAGVSFEPKEGSPLKADAQITTYFGQRKGVSGRVWVRYEF